MSVVRRAALQLQREFARLRPSASHTPSAPLSADGRHASHEVEAFARSALGTLAEPGDGVLGRLVGSVGATRTLDLLLDAASVERIAEEADAAGETLGEKELEAALARWTPRIDHLSFLRGLEQAERVGAVYLVPGDAAWPVGVDDLGAHAPLGLWVRGEAQHLRAGAPAVALVGARAATGYGEHVTKELSAGLVDRGITIVSGGAYGIDGTAHRAALASEGTTVAFLAGGVDRFYPAGHDGLLQRIAETGAVVSELPCGASPTKWRFLQRNRLIAAASSATVVLEAGARSGSLNTAAHAAALGRPLGALPGPVTSPASAGCHRLLREFDATCIVNADQVVELMGGPGHAAAGGATGRSGVEAPASADPLGSVKTEVEPSPEAVRLLDALSTRSARDLDELARRSGLGVREVRSVLGVLDLDGVVAQRAGGWVRRRRPA
ncbi:DNA-processing protein DprA [Agromyces sp. NPDC058110]|uniref:DNA-processing protein DprA n=1 Tax=Agromyces sp. NPDC058110 TaxID=3346345 RepID=UPI0036DCF5D2